MSTLRGIIRHTVLNRLFRAASKLVMGEDYADKAIKLAMYKYRMWEFAIEASADARHNPDFTDEQRTELNATALGARADFIDCMREYIGVDLLSADYQAEPEWPQRPTAYQFQETTLTTVGHNIPVKQIVLVKVQTSEMPKLNYPNGLFRGDALRNFVNEAKRLAEEQTT